MQTPIFVVISEFLSRISNMGKILGFLLTIAGLIFVVWSTSDVPTLELQNELNRHCEICQAGFSDVVVKYKGNVVNLEPIGKSLISKLSKNADSKTRAELEIFKKNSDESTQNSGEHYILQISIFESASGNKLDEVSLEQFFKTKANSE